jgi:DNA-directed RNA polymerase specialized sigma24 family protein
VAPWTPTRSGLNTSSGTTLGTVLSFVLTRTGPEEAKDVVAQTFLVAWRRFVELPEEPLPWLIDALYVNLQ